MAKKIIELKPFDKEGNLQVIVESPRASTIKLDYDPKQAVFTVSRALPLGMAYPFDWGFIPGTRAADGDPVDALVIHDMSTYPGVLLPCRALGMVVLSQSEDGVRELNNRIIALPTWNNRLGDVKETKQLPTQTRKEIEQFFVNCTLFTGKDVKIEGWKGRAEAENEVKSKIVRK